MVPRGFPPEGQGLFILGALWVPEGAGGVGVGTLPPSSQGLLPFPSCCAAGVLFSLEAMGRQVEAFPVATMATGIVMTTRWLCIVECLALALFYPR